MLESSDQAISGRTLDSMDSSAPLEIENNPQNVPLALRRTILRIFSKKYGLALHASALSFIHETLVSHGLVSSESESTDALEWLAKGLIDSKEEGNQGKSILVT